MVMNFWSLLLFFFSLRCSSRVRKRYAESAYQEISIADGCNHVSIIVHEMMHAIGNEFSLVFLKELCQAWDQYTFPGNCPLTSHLGQNVTFGEG